MISDSKICVVTVTYGRRWYLLKQVLREILSDEWLISDIIVVDNGAVGGLKEKIKLAGFDRTHVIRLDENTGSAGGYAAGIIAALNRTKAEFVWLLDDDNMPGPQALENLLHSYYAAGGCKNFAFLSMREGRKDFRLAVARGGEVTIRKNSFLGFRVVDIPKKLFSRLLGCAKVNDAGPYRFPLASVGHAPYGGLFLHRDLVGKIGLPDKQFYVYADDYEYSSRIIDAGGKIYLCATSSIVDLEASTGYRGGKVHPLISPGSEDFRIYYTIRNRIYLESRKYVSSRVVYLANGVVYLCLLAIHGLLETRKPTSVWRRLILMINAVKDGRAARLGKVDHFN